MPINLASALVPKIPESWQKLAKQLLYAGGTFDQKSDLATIVAGVGNTADTNEDTLASSTLLAGAMGTAPASTALRVRASGRCAGNGDTKTMRLYFGAEVIATPAAATNGKNWWLELVVTRTGASQQRVTGSGCVDVTPVTPLSTAGAENEAATILIKCTGQAGVGNANDIICDQLIIEPLT